MGPQIQWVHSYVTDNKIYCVYNAPNPEMVAAFRGETLEAFLKTRRVPGAR